MNSLLQVSFFYGFKVFLSTKLSLEIFLSHPEIRLHQTITIEKQYLYVLIITINNQTLLDYIE